MKSYIMSIDQGTTSSRAIIFDEDLNIVTITQQEIENYFPHPGWVEMDANKIWSSVKDVCLQALEKSGLKNTDIKAIGITNQRETTIVWNKKTGLPVYNALVWQSRQTAALCEDVSRKGYGDMIQEKTGLTIDPYFSASKIRWILDHTENGQVSAANGELMFGTVDSWLVYKLTNGEKHITDVSNASRTMLMDIDALQWDDDLLEIWNIPRNMLPEIVDSSQVYGYTDLLGCKTPIAAVIGDQQSALFGQTCFDAGQCKNTYGTGCFLLFNTGNNRINSNSGLVSTVGWKIGNDVKYVLEGSVFVAGAAIQWLRDGLKIITTAAESEKLATNVPDSNGVYVVPAFTGLGAPYWNKNAKGAIFGLTRGTTNEHLVRATLESLAYQTFDVIEALINDTGMRLKSLQVDGGACRNNYLMQFQSDILQTKIVRPVNFETTALGACMMAGLAIGMFSSFDELRAKYHVDREFEPEMSIMEQGKLVHGWKKAVKATIEF
ncbi:MAG: glycerol kinase GlpK [Erysipelotrichaceae bacterium]|nr:glycerol kinase GlpK [Erysipelotrichaceae bacterium]